MKENLDILAQVGPNIDSYQTPENVVRSEDNALTLNTGAEDEQRKFSETNGIDEHKWKPPSGDKNGRVLCQTSYNPITDADCEGMKHSANR